MEKLLGKISKVSFGVQEGQLGLRISFSMDGSGVDTSITIWDFTQVKRSEFAKWTEDDRTVAAIDMLKQVSKTLSDAKVSDVSKLLNVPVEVVIDRGLLKSWRILTEVL